MACQRAQADPFQNWLRWLKSFTEVKTILIAQNQGASVKPCGVPYELYHSYIIYIYIHITFALIYQWLAFYIAFFLVNDWEWLNITITKPLPGFTFWAFWTIVSSQRGFCICSAQEQVLADLPPKTEATRNAYFELAKPEFENWGLFFFGLTRYYQHPSEWIFYALWYDYLFQVSTVSNAARLMQRLSGLQIVLWLPLTRWQKVGRKWVVVVVVVVVVAVVVVVVLVLVLVFVLLLLLSCSLLFFFFAFPEDLWGEIRIISPEALGSKQSWRTLWALHLGHIFRKKFWGQGQVQEH